MCRMWAIGMMEDLEVDEAAHAHASASANRALPWNDAIGDTGGKLSIFKLT